MAAPDVSFAAQRLLFRDTTSFCLKVLQVLVDDTRGSWMETPIRTRNEDMFAENLPTYLSEVFLAICSKISGA